MNLNKWIDEMNKGYAEDNCEEHPDCPKCGNIMDFHGHDGHGDFPLGDGYWECPKCKFRITENEVWEKGE